MEKKFTREIYVLSGGPDGEKRANRGHTASQTTESSTDKTLSGSITPLESTNLNSGTMQSHNCNSVAHDTEHGNVVVTHFRGRGASDDREMRGGRNVADDQNISILEAQPNYGLSLSFKTVKNIDQHTNQLYTAFVTEITNNGPHLLEVLFLAVT